MLGTIPNIGFSQTLYFPLWISQPKNLFLNASPKRSAVRRKNFILTRNLINSPNSTPTNGTRRQVGGLSQNPLSIIFGTQTSHAVAVPFVADSCVKVIAVTVVATITAVMNVFTPISLSVIGRRSAKTTTKAIGRNGDSRLQIKHNINHNFIISSYVNL